MDSSTPNRSQDEPNEFRFGNHFMNDSGVENCSFLQNEALCLVKPPRILVNDVPLDITINRTLFNQPDHQIEENIENATASSGLGSIINGLNGTVASEPDQLTSFSKDTNEDCATAADMANSLLNRALRLVRPPKLLLNDIPFDTSESQSSSNRSGPYRADAEKTTKNSSKYSIEDGVIVIESDDEVDSIDTKLNRFLENYKPTISETRLKALHDISMQVVSAEKRKSPKRTMSLFNDMPSRNQPRPQSTEVNYDAEVIDLSKDDDLFNTTLERVDNILGDYKPKISEARLKTLHDMSMQVVNVEKRKSPKRTMSLFSETAASVAEMRRPRAPKRTISVEQFF